MRKLAVLLKIVEKLKQDHGDPPKFQKPQDKTVSFVSLALSLSAL